MPQEPYFYFVHYFKEGREGQAGVGGGGEETWEFNKFMKEQWKKWQQGVFPMFWETGKTEVKVAHGAMFSNRTRNKLWYSLRK